VEKPVQHGLIDGPDGHKVIAKTPAVYLQPFQRRRHILFCDQLCPD
jgi:hypothetical protein